jgi:hypothetical protein
VILARHLSRLVAATLRYGITGRRIGLLIAIGLGAVAVTLAAASSAAVPIVVYPFV